MSSKKKMPRFKAQLAVGRTNMCSGSDVWLEFIRYFETLMALNNWSHEKARRIFLCLLRGQAEYFAYRLPLEVQSSWVSLKAHMEERFGFLQFEIAT